MLAEKHLDNFIKGLQILKPYALFLNLYDTGRLIETKEDVPRDKANELKALGWDYYSDRISGRKEWNY